MAPPCSVLIVSVLILVMRGCRGSICRAGVDALEDPGPSVPAESFGPCAIAGAKFAAVSKVTVAPASSRVFISILRGDSADSGFAVVSRVCRLTAGRCQQIWR